MPTMAPPPMSDAQASPASTVGPVVRWWRKALAADIGLHLIAIFFFAYLPPSTLNHWEKGIMVLSTLALVGVVSHAFIPRKIPGDQWAYLLAGGVALYTLLVYETRTWLYDIPLTLRVTYGLFLLSAAVSSYAAHVIDGGRGRREYPPGA